VNKINFNISPIKLLATLLLVVLGFWGCNSNKGKSHTVNEIKRISITVTGRRPGKQMAISIDSTLTYFYMETSHFNDSTGIFSGKITQGFWDSINKEIEKIPAAQLDSSYKDETADCGEFVMLLTYNNKKREVTFNGCDCPRSFIDFYNWLWKNQKQIALKPCFEILPKPIPPPVEELKATPPKGHKSKHPHKKK
jgi:hypothetical protein